MSSELSFSLFDEDYVFLMIDEFFKGVIKFFLFCTASSKREKLSLKKEISAHWPFVFILPLLIFAVMISRRWSIR